MKLQNLLYATMVACAFSACSNDDDPNIPDPALEMDATLTALYNTVGDAGSSLKSTKANDDAQFNTINRIAIAVFNRGAMGNVMTTGALIAYKDLDNPTDNTTPSISAKSGNVSVLVIANPVDDMFDGLGTLDDFLGKIDEQAINSDKLLMSSKVYEVALVKGDNIMSSNPDDATGETKLVTGAETVKLYRNVARVEVPKITVNPRDGFGKNKGAKFTLKSIFVANARTSVRVGGQSGSVADILSAKTAWCVVANTDGNLSGIADPAPASPYLKDLSAANINVTYTSTPVEQSLDAANEVQIFVYDNASDVKIAATEAENKATLLVIKGDYEYTTETGSTVKSTDAYWTVPINNVDATATTGKDFKPHYGVLRNVKYIINPTITGPGSGTVTPESTGANLSAKVEVMNWGEVELNPDID